MYGQLSHTSAASMIDFPRQEYSIPGPERAEGIPPMKAKKLLSAGYVFRKDRENDKTHKTTWRCSKRHCPGRAWSQWSDEENRMSVHHIQGHIHPPDLNLNDAVEWVETTEIRRTTPISPLGTDDSWSERPRVDAATQLSAAVSSSETPEPTEVHRAPKRKIQHEPDVDLDFDVDLNVHFDVGGQQSGAGFAHSLPSTSAGNVQQTTKGEIVSRDQNIAAV